MKTFEDLIKDLPNILKNYEVPKDCDIVDYVKSLAKDKIEQDIKDLESIIIKYPETNVFKSGLLYLQTRVSSENKGTAIKNFVRQLFEPVQIIINYTFPISTPITNFIELEKIEDKKVDNIEEPKQEPHNTNSGIIYFLYEDEITDMFKIGMTTRSVKQRIRNLQTGNSKNIREYTSLKCDDVRFAETFIHKMFQSKRHIGEWFRIDKTEIDQLVRFINGFSKLKVEEIKENKKVVHIPVPEEIENKSDSIDNWISVNPPGSDETLTKYYNRFLESGQKLKSKKFNSIVESKGYKKDKITAGTIWIK